jgi:hypothetical protein
MGRAQIWPVILTKCNYAKHADQPPCHHTPMLFVCLSDESTGSSGVIFVALCEGVMLHCQNVSTTLSAKRSGVVTLNGMMIFN